MGKREHRARETLLFFFVLFLFLRFTLPDPKGRVGNTEFGNDTTTTLKNQHAARDTAEIQSPTKAGNSRLFPLN